MNQDIRSLLLGVVSNVLTMFLTMPFSKHEKKQLSFDSILKQAIEETSDTFEWSGRPGVEEVCLFLVTPEVESVLRQLFATKIVEKCESNVESIREEFISLFAGRFDLTKGQVKSSATRLFDFLLRSADVAFSAAVEAGVLAAHEAKSAVRFHQLYDEISAVQKNLNFLNSRRSPNIQEVLAFEERFRIQVADRHGRITPPNFDSARKLPLDDIYVAPHFVEILKDTGTTRSSNDKNLNLSAFLARIYRAVLLGNPGGGKSTLKDKLCYELAYRYYQRPLAGRTLLQYP